MPRRKSGTRHPAQVTDEFDIYEEYRAEEKTGVWRVMSVAEWWALNQECLETFQEVIRESIRTGEPKKDRLYEWKRVWKNRRTPEQQSALSEYDDSKND